LACEVAREIDVNCVSSVGVNIDCLESTVMSQDPLKGTGPRFFRPDFAAAFFKGVFIDEEAKEVPALFKKLGMHNLTAKMPPWMRLKLGRGALTPISKEQPSGDDPDARPVKAEDFDTSQRLDQSPGSHGCIYRPRHFPAPAARVRRLGWCGDPRAGAEALV